MDLSNTPKADQNTETTRTPLPGEKHNRDLSNPGELWGFLLAAALLGALGLGFALGGLAGVGITMVALVPVIYLVLILISVGR
ncbi:MAG: hypothetical protein KDK53_07790 [Maritimibacter sp.]|nr:hypothetical protein [Maritimibacter sp.]